MVGNRLADVRIACWTVACVALLAGSAARAETAAPANNCPGHPDAIGTSRTLVVDPRAHPRIGSMQYTETLPLGDHEAVLTFDDGPLPRNSNQVLQILADNCVKATFFIIGEQARANPEGVRKLIAAGHSVGTHSQRHPLTFHKMSEEQARQEIEQGIESTKAAVTDPSAIAPFFRIPGLLRAPPVEAYLESQGIQIWSTDFLADDWHRLSSAKVYDLAMKRMEAAGKGILLLHDIQARTVGALPKILHDMKARGFKIVHVVPSTPDLAATPTEPEQWQSYPPSENVPIAHWPKLPNFIYAESDELAAPAASNFDLAEGDVSVALDAADRARRRSGVPLPKEGLWPKLAALPAVASIADALPVPAATVFDLPEKARAAIQPLPLQMHHYAEGELPVSATIKTASAGPRGRHGRGVRHAARQVRHVAHAAPAGAKRQTVHPSGGAKRAVHVASLKKRKI
jgi:peptidoglycan/xylan/chitin deacetylase (PgdA/CDA1 family)